MDQTYTISSGREGTRETVAMVDAIARESAGHPTVIRQARSIVRNVPERDTAGEIRALALWVRKHVRYTKERVETLHNPVEMIEEIRRYGKVPEDCDGHVLLFSTLAASIAIPLQYQTLSQRRDHLMGHILVEARDQHGRWIPVELILKKKPIGYQPTVGVTARERSMSQATRTPTTRPFGQRRRRRRAIGTDYFRQSMDSIGARVAIAPAGLGDWWDDLFKSSASETATSTKDQSTTGDTKTDATATSDTQKVTDVLSELFKGATQIYTAYQEGKTVDEIKKLREQQARIDAARLEQQKFSTASRGDMAPGEQRWDMGILIPVAFLGILVWSQMGRRRRPRR